MNSGMEWPGVRNEFRSIFETMEPACGVASDRGIGFQPVVSHGKREADPTTT